MGAAVALQAAASTPNVCAVVAEASYASFREIGYERVAQSLHSSVGISHIIGWPMVNMALLYARLRYGLNLDQVSPERKLAASHVPALLIAGLADKNIPPRHSERIARLSGQRSELWLVPGADHTMAASVDPADSSAGYLDGSARILTCRPDFVLVWEPSIGSSGEVYAKMLGVHFATRLGRERR